MIGAGDYGRWSGRRRRVRASRRVIASGDDTGVERRVSRARGWPGKADEREQHNGDEGWPAEDAVDGEDHEREVSGEVEGEPGAERDDGQELEVVVELVERALDSEGEEDEPATIGRWR